MFFFYFLYNYVLFFNFFISMATYWLYFFILLLISVLILLTIHTGTRLRYGYSIFLITFFSASIFIVIFLPFMYSFILTNNPINQLVNFLNFFKIQQNFDCMQNLSTNNSIPCALNHYNQNLRIGEVITITLALVGVFSAFIYLFVYIYQKANFFFIANVDETGGSKQFHIYLLTTFLLVFYAIIISVFSTNLFFSEPLITGNTLEITLIWAILFLWLLLGASLAMLKKQIKSFKDISDLIDSRNKSLFIKIFYACLNVFPSFILISAIITLYLSYTFDFTFFTFLFIVAILLHVHFICCMVLNLPYRRYTIELKNPDLFSRLAYNNVYILLDTSAGYLKVIRENDEINTIMKDTIFIIKAKVEEDS
jgi:hypothetical protein